MSDLTQWLYKRSHAITSATTLINYQVKVIVNYSSGTSSGDTVYLDGKCKVDFGDIRFTDSNEDELSYWIESISGTLATIWVKVPSINTTTIWIYYGNESASTTSSGDTTFILFDHFDGSSINLLKWTVEKKGSASAIAQVNGSSILQLSGANGITSSANLISVSTFAQPFILEIREQINTTNGAYADTSFGLTTTLQDLDGVGTNWWNTSLGNSYIFTPGYNSNGAMFRSPLGLAYVSYGNMSGRIFPTANTYYRNKYIKTPTGIQFIRDGTTYGSANDTTYTGPFHICLNQGEYSGGSSYAGYRYIDYILVRNYSATEPTHGEWSEEQLVASYPLYITITPTCGTEPLSVSYTLYIRNALNNFILNFGDSNTYIGDDVTNFSTTHEYDTPGTYTVWAEGYNDFATHVYYEIPYGVTVSSQVVTTSFTYNQSNNMVQFTDTSTGSVNEWYWTFGDGSYSYEQNPHHMYTSIGTYTVTLYSSNQYQYGLYSIEIPVSTFTYVYPPVPNFKPACLNVITDDLPCSVQFTDLSFPTTGCTYYWTFGDTSTSTSQNPLHSYASLGVYDVSLTVTNDYGSSTITYEDCIKIHNEAKIFKENLTYNDEFSTFGIMLFIETPTYSDIFIKAKVFTDNCYYTQGEFPSDPGIDEYCNLSFYTNINEYCETLFDNVTDYLKRTVIDPVMSVLGFQKLKMKEFTETVYYDDVLSLEPPT